jgi:acetyl esterase/lipase
LQAALDGYALPPHTTMPFTLPLSASIPTPVAVRQTIETLSGPQQDQARKCQESGDVECTEHSYGPHERHKLDFYLPVSSNSDSTSTNASVAVPLVVFLYGGGFFQGDKRMPSSQGAIYQNVGFFFAKAKYACVVMDYRLCPQHNITFPSGGEDVATALTWLTKQEEISSKIDLSQVYLYGTSAGAFHLATFLWCPAPQRSWPQTIPGIRLAGFLCANLPAHFASADKSRDSVLGAYLGVDYRSKRGTLPMRASSLDATPTLIILAEHDMKVEIVEPVSFRGRQD